MDCRKPVLAAAAAFLLTALPAAAQTEAFSSGVTHMAVSESDMADLRGRAVTKVVVQVNDNNQPNTYSDVHTGSPSTSSKTVVTPTTIVKGTASVGGAGTIKPVVFAPVNLSRTITILFGSSSSNH